MHKENQLEKFGKFLVLNLRDKGISNAERLLKDEFKAPALLNLQADLYELSEEQKELVKKTVTICIDSAIHDFLFALQENADFDNNIQILVDGKNIVELSDGIHGEAYSDEGWYAKYSKYPEGV